MGRISDERKLLNENFEKLLRKFSLRDVKAYVLSLFEDLTWDILIKAINRYNLSSRKDDVARLLGEYAKNFPLEDLRELYGNLLLLDLMIHHKQKRWTAINMSEPDDIPDGEECASNIVNTFQKHAKIVNVYSNQTEDIRWFVIIICQKTKKNVTIYRKPIFLAHPQDSTIVFCSPSPTTINSETMKMLASSFGYRNYKIMKLNGNSIPSLRLMQNRHKDADKIRADMARALQSIKNGPVCSSKGLDFCENKTRAAHAKQMFGDESIELQTLTVNFNTEWRGVRTLPQAEGKQFNFIMRLKSKNVRKSLQEMVEKGVLKKPYPNWAKDILISGKNTINVA